MSWPPTYEKYSRTVAWLLVGAHYVRLDLIESWTSQERGSTTDVVVTTTTGGSYVQPDTTMSAFADRVMGALLKPGEELP